MQGARRPRGASRRCALQGQCQKNIGVRERSLSQTPVGRRVPFCIGFGLRATKRWAAAPPGGACARCRLRSAVCGPRCATLRPVGTRAPLTGPSAWSRVVDSGDCADVALSIIPGGTPQAVMRPAGSVVPAWQLVDCFPWGDTVTL